MLPAESLPFREPDEAKPKGLYACQVVYGPCSKRARVMNLLWNGSCWRYPLGYRFKKHSYCLLWSHPYFGTFQCQCNRTSKFVPRLIQIQEEQYIQHLFKLQKFLNVQSQLSK